MLRDEENRLVVVKGEEGLGKEGLRVWDQKMQTSIYKKQGTAVQYREVYSVFCDKPSQK